MRSQRECSCASVQPPELVVPLSRLRDVPESYSIFELKLVPLEVRTSLTVTTVTWFPTEEIFKHLDFLLARHTPNPEALHRGALRHAGGVHP